MVLMKAHSSFFLATFFQLLSLMPLPVLRFMGRAVGRLLWYSNSGSRKVTEENLLICFPDMPVTERQQLARRSLQHLGIMAMELAYVWHRPVPRILATVKQVEGMEHMRAASAEGKGVILLAPHLGNWEVVGLYASHYFSLTTMFQPPDSPALGQIIQAARERSGSTLVPTNISGVKALLKALKKGDVVGVLPDQVPPLGSGDFAPFFNIPALTPSMISNLIQRTSARVVLAYARRLESGGFEMVFEPAPEALYSADPIVSLTALNHCIESAVLKIPEQYQWEYKRFKKQPNGEKKYYR
jgi:Kdo2-lipid IVA lauroyltransferase/acyltransferase